MIHLNVTMENRPFLSLSSKPEVAITCNIVKWCRWQLNTVKCIKHPSWKCKKSCGSSHVICNCITHIKCEEKWDFRVHNFISQFVAFGIVFIICENLQVPVPVYKNLNKAGRIFSLICIYLSYWAEIYAPIQEITLRMIFIWSRSLGVIFFFILGNYWRSILIKKNW